MKKVIIIYSGGLDSTVLLYWLKNKGYDVKAITLDYGQRHSKEIESAMYNCHNLSVEHKIITLPLENILTNSALIDTSKDLPKEHYTHENQKVTVVPNRNMIMLSIAVAWAENEKIKEVYFAAHANDKTVYPDCRPEFVEAVSKASQLGTYNEVKIVAPFTKKTKADLVKIGHKLDVPFGLTWSCYRGTDIPCLKCATCQERLEAFKVNNLTDPLLKR